jgi:hypothetical protein
MSFLFHTASSELKPHRKTPAQDSKAYTHNHKQDGEATAGSITHTTAAASCAQNSTRTAVAASTDRFTASRRVARGRITGRRLTSGTTGARVPFHLRAVTGERPEQVSARVLHHLASAVASRARPAV